MMTEVVGAQGADLRVGMDLEVTFREAAEGVWVAVFGVRGG